mgnify:CR=1 FL=1
MKFDVALGTSVVVMAFDGERLVALIGEKSQEPYKGAPMLPSNWVSAGVSVEEVAKRMMNRILGVEKIYLEQRCIDTPVTGFTVVYGVSNNDRAAVDNSKASFIGFRPKDNAEQFAEKILAETDVLDSQDPGHMCHGGPFAKVDLGESGLATMTIIDDKKVI